MRGDRCTAAFAIGSKVGMVLQDLHLQRRGNNCLWQYVIRIVDRAKPNPGEYRFHEY